MNAPATVRSLTCTVFGVCLFFSSMPGLSAAEQENNDAPATAGTPEVEQRMEQLPATAGTPEVEQRMEQLPATAGTP
jgi:hypothetical protein